MVVLEKWNVTDYGYTPITTFWQDFCIAEKFGHKAVRDTFNRAFDEWKGNYKYLTELVMVLNCKIWRWYGVSNVLAETYNELWEKADLYAVENLMGEEAEYFYSTTD